MKNEYSLRKMLRMSWVLSPAKKKKKKENDDKRAKIYAESQALEEGAEDEEGE